MITALDKKSLRKKADREVLYLLGAFVAFWALLGWLGYSVFSLVQCSQRFGDVKGACAKAMSLPLVPEDLKSRLRLSLIEEHITKGERADAIKVMTDEENAGYATADLFSRKAELLNEDNKTEEAAAAYRKALDLEPDNDSYNASLVGMELSAGKIEDARTDAAKFLVTNPKSATGLSWAGWIEHRDGKYEQAVQLYERAIAYRADDGWLYYDLGIIHANVGDNPKALTNYNAAINLDPTNPSFLSKRAALHNDMGEHVMAQTDYLALLEQSRSADHLIGLARSYTDSRDFEKAAPLLEEALKEDDTSDWAHDSKIRLLYRQEKYDEARTAVAELKRKNPDTAYVTYWTASLDDEAGKDEAALAGYLKAAETWNTDPGMQTDIGHVLIDLKRPDEALAHFQNAVTMAPRSANSYVSRARAFLHLSRWQEAIADANTALDLEPENGIAYSRRANAEWGQGQTALAKTDYETAVRLSPFAKWLRGEQIDFLLASKLLAEAQVSINQFAELDQSAAAEWQTRLDQARQALQ